MGFFAFGLHRGEEVSSEVVDLSGFINAAPDSYIFVRGNDGEVFRVKKSDVSWTDINQVHVLNY